MLNAVKVKLSLRAAASRGYTHLGYTRRSAYGVRACELTVTIDQPHPRHHVNSAVVYKLTSWRRAVALIWSTQKLARDLVTEIRAADGRLAQLVERMNAALAEHGSRLPQVPGIGPVIAARLVGRVGDPTRFPGTAAFANYTGVAPIEVASGTKSRHRLSRGGDRQLNSALHLVAVTQIRMKSSAGRSYYDTKRASGKTHKEGVRCLKRRLADHVWRLNDRRSPAASRSDGPGRTHGGDSAIQRG